MEVTYPIILCQVGSFTWKAEQAKFYCPFFLPNLLCYIFLENCYQVRWTTQITMKLQLRNYQVWDHMEQLLLFIILKKEHDTTKCFSTKIKLLKIKHGFFHCKCNSANLARSRQPRKKHVRVTNMSWVEIWPSKFTANPRMRCETAPPHASFEFSFWTNVIGYSQFCCSFDWPGVSHYLDVYVDKRDRDRCKKCYWDILPNGPCMYAKCFGWNPKYMSWVDLSQQTMHVWETTILHLTYFFYWTRLRWHVLNLEHLQKSM